MNETNKNEEKKKNSESFPDWILFIDDDGEQKDWFVKIIEISTFVKFETSSGNIFSIPYTRVLKIKQRAEQK